jgi:hypothetical protein
MRFALLYALLLLLARGNSQTSRQGDFFNDFNFIIHLTNNKLFTEAESEKARLFANGVLPQRYRDSVNYFLGLAYYKDKMLPLARQSLLKVSDETFLFYNARYVAGNIDAGNTPDSALQNFLSIPPSTNPELNELNTFEIAGIYLLKKDHVKFDSIATVQDFKNPVIVEEFANLRKYAERDRKIKRKSPFLAGTLSAMVPGLGKVYAGNNGQALASFLTCGLMAAVAGENYYRLGITHPQTIFFSGLFGFFYLGNIWGSAISVQLVKIEQQFENKHNILVGLQLPVHRFFN